MRLTIPILGFTALVSALPQPSTPPPSFKITNVVSGGTGCPQGSINATWTDEQILPISTSTLLHPQAPIHQSTILTDTPQPRLQQILHRIRRPHHRHHRVAQELPAQPRPHLHPGLHIRRVQRHIRGVCRPRSRRDGRAEEHVLLLRVCGTSTSPPPFNPPAPAAPSQTTARPADKQADIQHPQPQRPNESDVQSPRRRACGRVVAVRRRRAVQRRCVGGACARGSGEGGAGCCEGEWAVE